MTSTGPRGTDVTKSTFSTKVRGFWRTIMMISRQEVAISGAPPAPGSRIAGRS